MEKTHLPRSSNAIVTESPSTSTIPLLTGAEMKASVIGDSAPESSSSINQRAIELEMSSEEATSIHWDCTRRTQVTERVRWNGIDFSGHRRRGLQSCMLSLK